MSARRMLLGLVLLLSSTALLAQELDPAQGRRYQHLIGELRCLVCQNQNIADSNADLAKDLREQVRGRIAAGESDEQIRKYLTDRYGDFVLYRPPFRARTAVLWLGPFALVLLALVLVLVFMRRSRRVPAVATADPAKLKALLDERE